MVLYIVRHGETEENKQRILQGHMQGNLTELGKSQVRQTAEELAGKDVKFRCIVSSDLKRAMDSARIISERLGIPVVEMKMLRERNWGKYTGISIDVAKDKFYADNRWDFPETTNEIDVEQTEFAESDEAIYRRAMKAIDLLKEEYGDDAVIVVTHGQFARNMIATTFDCSYHEVTQFMNAEVRILEV